MNDLVIINEMKCFFKSEIYKGRLLNWGIFYDHINKFGLSDEIITQLKTWFISINEFQVLKSIPDQTEEVFIHNADTCYIKNANHTGHFDHDYTQEDIELMLLLLSIQKEQNWNYSNPFVSFNTNIFNRPYRVTLIHHSLDPEKQTKAFFRVLNKDPISLDTFNYSYKLKELVQKKKNILIAGSTGSGKTTLINSLLTQTDPSEHSIILEDTYELVSPSSRTSRLISDHIGLDELLSYSLRMSPDRIVLGEIRSKEVLTYILGMNTGHKGMITSIHSNSAKDSLLRMATLYATYADSKMNYEMILKLVCSNIDYVIYLENKQITEIIEVYGAEGSNTFYDNAV